MIFSLPFHVPRYFRASLLESFELTNTQLGDVFAVYGIAAMLAYFPGGLLADHISTRTALASSLMVTALGGCYLVTQPGPVGLMLLYAYWGLSTILLFWAALIRATRLWGGDSRQGRAFGVLDGGRGLAAALFASLAVVVFAQFVPLELAEVNPHQRLRGMRAVIWFYTALTALSALLIALCLAPDESRPKSGGKSGHTSLRGLLGAPVVWLQAGIVVCAYCGYKGLDNYALYAHQVLGMTETESARFTAYAAYIRPLAAIVAGLLADRFGAARIVVALFATMLIAYGVLAAQDGVAVGLIFANLLVTFFAVFALRGVYFALLHQSRIPLSQTGAAVGIVSVVGYTPDIFFAPLAGRILDATPGAGGHQNYFILLSLIALTGFTVAVLLSWLLKRQTDGELNE